MPLWRPQNTQGGGPLIPANGGTGVKTIDALKTALGVSLTDLGVTAFAQTLLDDANAAAVLATLGLSADLLDIGAFEEGTFTPAYAPASGSFTSVTYDSRTGGFYTRIGDAVLFSAVIVTDAITVGTAAGAVAIDGLPFTVANFSRAFGAFQIWSSAFVGVGPNLGETSIDTTLIIPYYDDADGDAPANIDVTDLDTGANDNYAQMSGVYFAA